MSVLISEKSLQNVQADGNENGKLFKICLLLLISKFNACSRTFKAFVVVLENNILK